MATAERTRVVVTGVAGRMGSTLVKLVRADPALELVGGTERPEVVGAAEGVGVPVVGDLGQALDATRAQVVIDFTHPDVTLANARACAERKVALVVGSTGFGEAGKGEMAAFAQKTPIVMAPNMSVGVNVVIRMAAELARLLGNDFDVEVLEAHHRHKKDAPSGTALRLAEELAAALGRDRSAFVLAREGQVGERTPEEIGIQTLRGGDVVGDHTVFFYGEGERVELTHRATSRDQFGRGALRAAKWIVGRAPGLYDIQHVLGLRTP